MTLSERPIVVLDRDGVINHDSDHYIKSLDEFVPIAGSLEAMGRLSHEGWRIFVATNQSGLARGLFDLQTLHAMHNKLQDLLEEMGGTKITDGTLDVAIMVNCLFQTEDKATAILEMGRTLRSGGKLFIIDWSESWGGMGPQVGQVVTEKEARAIAETAGFVFERTFDAGGHHYGLAFRKG